MTVKRTAEQDVLVVCARPRLTPADVMDLRRLLYRGIDWEAIIQSGKTHGLLPLLGRHLNRHAADLIPPDTALLLSRLNSGSTARSMYFTLELRKLFGSLTAAGIPAIPLKGPVLALSLYGDVTLRSYSDLDIYVPRCDLERAASILVSNEYAFTDFGDAGRTSFAEGINRREFYHAKFRKPAPGLHNGGRAYVELHWNLTPQLPWASPSWEEIWKRRRRIPFQGSEITSLSRTDELLFLCLHGMKHSWQRLEWLCALATAAEMLTEEDWRVVEQGLRQYNCERAVLTSLAIAESILRTQLPRGIHERIARSPIIRNMADIIERSVFQDQNANAVQTGLTLLALCSGPGSAALYLWHKLTYPSLRDEELFRLPQRLRPVYAVLRPFRLAIDYPIFRKPTRTTRGRL